MSSEEVSEELEAVTAILDEDTVEIVNDDNDSPKEISIKITPLTASEQEKQYVSLTLVVTITEGILQSHGHLTLTYAPLPLYSVIHWLFTQKCNCIALKTIKNTQYSTSL